MTLIEKLILVEFLEDYGEVLGNAGCNDWSCTYGPAIWEKIQSIFQYGIDNNLWDKDGGPTQDGKKIYWQDFMLVSYFKHLLKKEIESSFAK